MSWYKNMDDNQIASLKTNQLALKHLEQKSTSGWMASAFLHIPPDELIVLTKNGLWKRRWEAPADFLAPDRIYPGRTYRLRPDWERPKRKAVVEGGMMKAKGGVIQTVGTDQRMIEETKGWPEGRYRITVEEIKEKEEEI